MVFRLAAVRCDLSMKVKKMKNRRYGVLLIFSALPLSAYAYVDPGSGMLVWQGMIALVGAIIMFGRNPLQSIKALWKRVLRK